MLIAGAPNAQKDICYKVVPVYLRSSTNMEEVSMELIQMVTTLEETTACIDRTEYVVNAHTTIT